MAFKRQESAISVPTHLKWIVQNPDKQGIEVDVTLILINDEWRSFTFFTEEFKLNVKEDTDEEFLATRDELYKSLKRGYCIAKLTDKSNIDAKEYTCDITLDSISEAKGGRKYELGKKSIRIAKRVKSDSAQESPA